MNTRYIYKIISPTNRIYIGQTNNPRKRKSDYNKLRCKSQTKLYNSILKYGWNTHKFEIIETIEHDIFCYEITNACEIYWIKVYDCVNLGLNILSGGGKAPVSKETREKLKILGQNKSPETIEKWKESNKGKLNKDDDERKQISETLKKKYAAGEKIGSKGTKRTDEFKKLQKEAKLKEVVEGKNKKCKKIDQFDLENNFIKTWDSFGQIDAAGYKENSVWAVCKNKNGRVTAFGYKWKYHE